MALSFYNSWREVSSTPSEYWSESLQALIDDEFENASNVYTIEEENIRGTLQFSNTTCRICHVISDKQTGEKMGDDWRTLIFPTLDHDVFIGKRFRFDNNIFICTSTDNYHYVTKSCVIRRCNNLLRWIDAFGNKIQEPCVLEYKIMSNGNDNNSNIITPDGYINVTAQYNNKTKLIPSNKRFLFGNPRVAYKIRGGGINNFLNQNTFDDDSIQLIKLTMNYDPSNNATDDIENGYADAYQNNYTISIDQGTTLEQNVGYNSSLSATVKLNGNVVNDIPLVWESSDPTVVQINQSNGSFILNAVGSSIITCSMFNNPLVKAEIVITSNAAIVDNYVVRISDNITEILQGQSYTYTVNFYKNNVIQSDTFIITASGVPTMNYKLTVIDDNHFKVDNLKMYSTSPLIITCTSGSYSESIEINLKGVW